MSSTTFPLQSRVVLEGLKSRPELNGRVGAIHEYIEGGDGQRIGVLVDGTRSPISIKKSNLRLVTTWVETRASDLLGLTELDASDNCFSSTIAVCHLEGKHKERGTNYIIQKIVSYERPPLTYKVLLMGSRGGVGKSTFIHKLLTGRRSRRRAGYRRC